MDEAQIKMKAQELLYYTIRLLQKGESGEATAKAVFGICGKANELLPVEEDRQAFQRTPEHQLIVAFCTMPDKPHGTTNGHISVRMPRSLHAALLVEAKNEGVSLNQLCVSKLAIRLAVVLQPPSQSQ